MEAQQHHPPVIVGGVVQHDELTPVELLYLTPRRVRMLMALLESPQMYWSEALLYFTRVGVTRRTGEGKYELTEPRGRELALRIQECRPPLADHVFPKRRRT